MTSVKLKDGKQCKDMLPKSERTVGKPIIIVDQDKDKLCSIGLMTVERYDFGTKKTIRLEQDIEFKSDLENFRMLFTRRVLSYRYVEPIPKPRFLS